MNSWSIWVTLTRHHEEGDYKQYSCHGSAGRKTKMRVTSSFGPDEDPLCVVDDLSFPGKKRQESPLGVSFIKIIILLGRTLACEMLHL